MAFDQTHWQVALEAWGAGRPATALVQLRRFVAAHPGNWSARLVLARVLTDVARYDDARVVLAALIEDPLALSDQGRGMLLLAIAEVHDRAGEHDAALVAYQRLRDHTPGHTDSYIFAGAVLARLGRLAEAEAMYRDGTTCADGCVDEAFHNLGLVLRAQERLVEARAAFAQALLLDPAYAAARAGLDDVTAALAAVAG